MKELSILDKFDAVEITNNSRINGDELEYCERNQALYKKILAHHRKLFTSLWDTKEQHEAFMENVVRVNDEDDKNSFRYACEDFELGKLKKRKFANDTIGGIHERFIGNTITFFKERYNVDLLEPEFRTILGMEEPEEPYSDYGWGRNRSEEEIAELRAKRKVFEAEQAVYLDAVINLEIDYNIILDSIFVQLDGKTFAEMAELEIKAGSRDASKSYHGDCLHTLKNKRISIQLMYPTKGWNDCYSMDLNKPSYLAILRALTYFDSKGSCAKIYPGWHWYVGYNKSESDGIFDTHEVNGKMVTHFRYFKNGKFEVTFDSHIHAQQFAEEYLFSGEVEDVA